MPTNPDELMQSLPLNGPLSREHAAAFETHVIEVRKAVSESLSDLMTVMGDAPRAVVMQELGEDFRTRAANAVDQEILRRRGLRLWGVVAMVSGTGFMIAGVQASMVLLCIAVTCALMLFLQARAWPLINAMLAEHASAVLVAGGRGVFKYDMLGRRVLLMPYDRIAGAVRRRSGDGWEVVVDFVDGQSMAFGQIEGESAAAFVAAVKDRPET